MDFKQFVANVPSGHLLAAVTFGEKNMASLLEAFNKKMTELPSDVDVQIQCSMQDRTPEGLTPGHDLVAVILIIEANEGHTIWNGSVCIGASPVVWEVERDGVSIESVKRKETRL